ncbi:MAG TPA: lytic transglycosylase domain-containing protein [Beijerinckiaceae bacterium]|nr:lytic transglycosylase domain-containing protein [Beijerinckiaceae bacterium]
MTEYRAGRLTEGDAIAARVEDDAARAALEWSAIRLGRQAVGFARIARFWSQFSDFPMAGWVRRRAEEALFVEQQMPARVLAFFKDREPEMAAGKVALARVLTAQGQAEKANALVRSAWRENRSSQSIRAAIQKEFPDAISAADIRHLAEKLIYRGESAEGLRIATLAGSAAVAQANILAASINETGGALALVQKLEPAQQGEAPAVFARVQHFRRAGQIATATQAMLNAPRDVDKLGDADEWWVERRMMVRKALDSGDPASAYRIAAEHSAVAPHNRVDAEVHAGWVALQYLGKPDVAARHFAQARREAKTPHSIARAAFWQGRAADAAGDGASTVFYTDAARHSHVYHGQLARARLGSTALLDTLDEPPVEELEAATRHIGLRAIRALLDGDARDLAQPLIAEAANTASTQAAAIAVGDLAARFGLPRLTLLAGKSAMQRGLKVEEHAFPVFGIPQFETTPDMAEAPIVYAIARQESEFDPNAVSHAGARGLMQLMPETARRTAQRAKLPFDVGSLTANPALNARIGAAHLGELFAEYNGSYILAFAAYNAGGKRVKEWIAAYGDPRDPQIDKIDWIERIPITETRHYVQKVLENVQVYRWRLNRDASTSIIADMTRGARRNRNDLAYTDGPPAP